MTLSGFDPRWRDFPDYILGITKEIWEDRRIDSLRQSYAPDIHVRSPAGVVTGNEPVIAATMATLAEFPDRTLLGEDVIWSEAGAQGYLSSHRIISQATKGAPGAYGSGTGQALQYRIIADCAAKDGVIYDEWIIRDQAAIVRQMGQRVEDWVRDRIAAMGDRLPPPLTPATEPPAVYTGTGNAHPAGQRYAEVLTQIMQGAMDTVPKAYDRACEVAHPGGVTGHGWGPVDQFWMGLRSAFPSARFAIHHQIGRGDPDMPPRAALRWSLTGAHEGWGAFGAPSGREVHVMGLSHAEIGPWGLRREWVLIDETAVWTQILA